jgi:hypothetical protein
LKTKKLLAIVTLVAFMMSLLPTAVFALNGGVVAAKSRLAVEDDTATADATYTTVPATELEVEYTTADGDYLEYTLYPRDAEWEATSGEIYIATTRPDSDVIVVNGVVCEQTDVAAAYVNFASTDELTIKVYSDVPGTTKLGVGKNPSVVDYVQGINDATTISAGMIANESGAYLTGGTFTAADADSLTITSVIDRSGDPFIYDATDVDYADQDFQLANGTGYYKIYAALKTKSGVPVAGKKVSFALGSTGAKLSVASATTDINGKVNVKVYADKPGTYEVTLSADDVDDVEVGNLKFVASGIYSIVAASDNDQKIAKEEKATFEFGFKDANGYTYEIVDGDVDGFDNGINENGLSALEDAELTVVSSPSGADFEDFDDETQYTLDANSDGNLELTIKEDVLDAEGAYSIKLTLANGKSLIYNFTVKEQGTIVKMTLKYDSYSLPAIDGTYSSDPDVELLDAEGYKKDADLAKVTFSVSDNELVRVLNAAETIDEVTYGKGAIEVIDTDKGTVTVTAVNTDKNIVATATIKIVKPGSSLKVTAPSYNTVGEDATVKIQLVDVDGNAVTADANADETKSSITILSKPAGAIINTDFDGDLNTDFKDKGSSSFTISSSVVGTVNVQVIVEAGGKYYTGATSVNFGVAAAAKKGLIMFVGSLNYMVDGVPAITDAAPFIENGRTFVAVRPIGQALGADIAWNEATKTVTLTKPGEVMTIVIGASSIKVDRAGVVTEYPCDAPAQIKAGRTYLPFRCIGEAMGYTVNFDAATGAVSFS